MSAYINMVCDNLKNSIPKAVAHCQVREAKRSLLDGFYTNVGGRDVSVKTSVTSPTWSCLFILTLMS